jgi:hypothetical protein
MLSLLFTPPLSFLMTFRFRHLQKIRHVFFVNLSEEKMKHVYRQSAYVFGKKMYFLIESYQKPIVSCLKKAWLGGFACDLIG